MSEHAKGPWKIHPVDDTSVIDATGAEVACVGGDYNQPETWPIMEANARLIARAPEMAEEIERLTDEVATLKGQLPEGMEHCKILFEECPVGHGHLRGDNWIKHECDHCKVLALTARVEELEGAAAFTPTHRHKARGSVYQEIGIAELQSATRIQEGAWLTIYRAEDGRLWARPTREFRDGRFEVLPRAAITKGERK